MRPKDFDCGLPYLNQHGVDRFVLTYSTMIYGAKYSLVSINVSDSEKPILPDSGILRR